MLYFAYGSNMSSARLQKRVPSAVPLGCYKLEEHDLRFHKVGKDNSGKGDAYITHNKNDVVYGALFRIEESEKPALDRAEGLGQGYREKEINVIDLAGGIESAVTYTAIMIDESLKPYSWYLNHVLRGAEENGLPENYIEEKILAVEAVKDSNTERAAGERAIQR
ncbi:gamma-glutamylcyclotransferase family protein [Idiomarina sp. HP20-50]|uniref:gamma-glutamylcyclotransferase family protein n=1 Tax=Idiomarina sp. HP20-50 TaxID=3070813 RepID=UPI00294AC542|nr:gamma-glutamylcyclotransferase family protein [Idiomarina sp. HP20-50]MDV6315327.1 gamma-glutamylcyclotransferase family protein [Idiomarina sp. HP20-50]